jgi:hypothetical protein
MRGLIAILMSLVATLSAPNAAAEAEALYCVPHCTSRSINGMCLDYGADFCTPYPGTACIEHCTDRTITLMRRQYGADFCGIEPYCQPYCEERSVTGMCLRYGQDACVSY